MKTLIALLALSLPANAQGIDMIPYYDNAPPKVERVSAPAKKAKPKPKKKTARKAAPKQGYGFRSPTPPPSDSVTRCLAPVRVVGSQDVRESAAEDSAKKAWMELVRWQAGEAFMDASNWTAFTRRCSRSSIGEIVGQVFYRCEIVASPCRPGMVEGTK